MIHVHSFWKHLGRKNKQTEKLSRFLSIEVFLSTSFVKMLFNVFREEQERLAKIETEMRVAEESKRKEMERIQQEEEHRRL